MKGLQKEKLVPYTCYELQALNGTIPDCGGFVELMITFWDERDIGNVDLQFQVVS